MKDKRLLVIDERPGFCEYVRRVASDLGYQVETASDMRAFTAQYEAFAPTALFVDLITLGSGVIELSLWLAENGFSGRLIVTGVMDVTKAKFILGQVDDLGPVTIMIKPVRLKDLREALSRARGE
jgi:DNA-binding NtrC family response regulator